MKKTMAALALLAGAAAAGGALAQDGSNYPTKPIRLVVTYAPGGSTDVVARLVAQDMTKQLGQNVIIENRAGANGAIGAEYVVKAAPDGYTLCYCTTGPTVILPLIDPKLPYNPAKDLQPVTHVVNQPFAIVVRSDLGINTLQELIRYAKANPQKFTYGSPGAATPMSLTAELLAHAGGVKFTAVQYRGDQPAVVDLLGGQIEGMSLATALVRQTTASGKVKVLAVSSAARLRDLPNVPTVAESGYPDFATNNFHGVFAPAGTPAAIVEKLHAAISSGLQSPATSERMLAESLVVSGAGPQAFAAFMRDEARRWQTAVTITNLVGRGQ